MNHQANGQNGLVKQEFGATTQLAAPTETAGSAVAAQAKAMVEARYIMALQRPRNWDAVRQTLIAECRRPNFANNKSAYYRKPIGKGVEGLGKGAADCGYSGAADTGCVAGNLCSRGTRLAEALDGDRAPDWPAPGGHRQHAVCRC